VFYGVIWVFIPYGRVLRIPGFFAASVGLLVGTGLAWMLGRAWVYVTVLAIGMITNDVLVCIISLSVFGLLGEFKFVSFIASRFIAVITGTFGALICRMMLTQIAKPTEDLFGIISFEKKVVEKIPMLRLDQKPGLAGAIVGPLLLALLFPTDFSLNTVVITTTVSGFLTLPGLALVLALRR
jgi:hypothetical protein